MFDLNNLLRENIRNLVPYSSARDEFKGQASVFLDANENSFGSPLDAQYNRYPDPMQQKLKEKISRIKGVPPQHIFIGNGSDEAIDILFRAFCNPGKDNVILLPPTYGMYEVSAHINDVAVRKIPLLENFQMDIDSISEAIDENTKLIFICSPNNPTGNSMEREDIEIVLNNFDGIVVVDEAYINFAKQKTMISELTEYPNLVILQTLSKAWGLAGLRVGMAFASEEVTGVFNKIKPPYNVNAVSQQLALDALENVGQVNGWIRRTVEERERMVKALAALSFVKKIFPSDANFLLVRVDDAPGLYRYLVEQGIVVRDRSNVILCEGCLRITVGTEAENTVLMEALMKK
ncbi:MAG: histidinol-phosphate aminotransferase [Bacteroidetes bacterium]|nr:MAG: histidinol-phosphate aminotransferase [Bacteroidota bacterium]